MDMNEYLAHIGMPRRSGRYPWGSGDRPFQSAEKGKSRGKWQKDSPRHTPSSARKLAKERAASLEKARKAKAEKAEFEKNKKNALEKGSATEVLKYKNYITAKELQDAYSRLNYENLIAGFASKEAQDKANRFWNKVSSIADKLNKTSTFINNGTNAWNAFAKVWNTFSTNSKMTIIDGTNRKDQKNQPKQVKVDNKQTQNQPKQVKADNKQTQNPSKPKQVKADNKQTLNQPKKTHDNSKKKK